LIDFPTAPGPVVCARPLRQSEAVNKDTQPQRPYIGSSSEVDAIATYAFGPQGSVEFGYAHFFRGDYIKQSLSARGSADANWFYAQLNFNFYNDSRRVTSPNKTCRAKGTVYGKYRYISLRLRQRTNMTAPCSKTRPIR
jgi:hypothetical protein